MDKYSNSNDNFYDYMQLSISSVNRKFDPNNNELHSGLARSNNFDWDNNVNQMMSLYENFC